MPFLVILKFHRDLIKTERIMLVTIKIMSFVIFFFYLEGVTNPILSVRSGRMWN